MESYQVPAWDEHTASKKGRKLLMLSFADLLVANQFIKSRVSASSEMQNEHHYNRYLMSEAKAKTVLDINMAINKLVKGMSEREDYGLMDQLNADLNRYFSIDGWRYIRAEIRQIRKRKSRVRVDIDLKTYTQLTHVKERLGLSSINEVVGYLLDNQSKGKQ